MLKLLLRIAMAVAGLAFLVDAGLPFTTQALHVDGHSTSTSRTSGNTGPTRDTTYHLKFADGGLDSCSVGYATYSRLNDGDAVTVKSSRLLKSCVSIERAGETVHTERYWKTAHIALGILLIVIALGWIKTEEGTWSWH